MRAADIRGLFPGLQDTIYLNTASMNVGCAPAREAYELAVERWSAGRFDWMDAERAGEEARTIFAEIVGATAGEIAIVPAVSTAAGIVAANLPPAKRGENVVVAGNEFASNYYPWLLLRNRGYEVRAVAPGGDGMTAKEFGQAADGGTRLIAVSAVHSANGYRADLAALSQVAARSGAWFFVDACQAAGAVPLDVVRDGVDFLAAASHKFLLGSRGMGYLYVRSGLLDRIQPVGPGWKAARNPAESFYGPAMDLSPTASKLDGPSGTTAFAVDTTTRAPRQAASMESGSRKSPKANSAPIARRCSWREPFRTNARTGLPDAASRRTTAVPNCPVAPTTRIMARSLTSSLRCHYGRFCCDAQRTRLTSNNPVLYLATIESRAEHGHYSKRSEKYGVVPERKFFPQGEVHGNEGHYQ